MMQSTQCEAHSRSLDYVEKIKVDTKGQGVDVVLNTLTGEGFVEGSLGCCAKSGRFIELSKRDIWSEGEVKAFRSDVHYHIVAIDTLSQEDPYGERLYCKRW